MVNLLLLLIEYSVGLSETAMSRRMTRKSKPSRVFSVKIAYSPTVRAKRRRLTTQVANVMQRR